MEVTRTARLSIKAWGRMLAANQETIETASRSGRTLCLRLHNPMKAKPTLAERLMNAEVIRSFKPKAFT
jgi:hypothetical protein